jgi:hypothetical protein
MIVELAVETGIPMSEWRTAEHILTAFEVLEAKHGN